MALLTNIGCVLNLASLNNMKLSKKTSFIKRLCPLGEEGQGKYNVTISPCFCWGSVLLSNTITLCTYNSLNKYIKQYIIIYKIL